MNKRSSRISKIVDPGASLEYSREPSTNPLNNGCELFGRILWIFTYLTASLLPSLPQSPNLLETRISLTSSKCSSTFPGVASFETIHLIFTVM